MVNHMFVLRPTEKKLTVVCPTCVQRGEVVSNCRTCHGTGTKKKSIQQYYVQDRPIEIVCVDRDPENGILRYWENTCEFFHETLYPELNKYVPKVPYGVHLCHGTMKSAIAECDRINKYLKEANKETFDTDTKFIG